MRTLFVTGAVSALGTLMIEHLMRSRMARMGAAVALLGGLLCLSLGACTQPQIAANLQAQGVSATTAAKVSSVVSTAVADGTLFCQFGAAIAAVPGVNVKGATSQTVANACATAQIIGQIASAMTPVPVAPPAAATSVQVATVAPLAAAAVAQSVKP